MSLADQFTAHQSRQKRLESNVAELNYQFFLLCKSVGHDYEANDDGWLVCARCKDISNEKVPKK